MSKQEKKPLRCSLGFHAWVDLGKNFLMTDTVEQCQRCRIGRHFVGPYAGYLTYSAEQMKQAWAEGRIRNEAARIQIYGPAKDATHEHQLSLFPVDSKGQMYCTSSADQVQQ